MKWGNFTFYGVKNHHLALTSFRIYQDVGDVTLRVTEETWEEALNQLGSAILRQEEIFVNKSGLYGSPITDIKEEAEFKPGNIVKLKSGGPNMTLLLYLGDHAWRCGWFDKKECHQADFSEAALLRLCS
jgi:uncharacterized protein YodC (DUF2158 family)